MKLGRNIKLDVQSLTMVIRRIIRENGRDYVKTYIFAAVCLVLVAASTAFMAWIMESIINEAFAKGSPVLRRPEWRLSKTPYVPGVDGRKMSKSYGNNLPLFESGKRLRKLCAKIVTDSTELGQPLPLRRRNGQGEEVHENVYALLELFCDEAELEEIRGYYRAGQRDGQPFGWGHAKMLLAEKIDQHFAEARQRREHFVAHPEEVEAVLRRSAERARAEARRTIDACKQACGLS